MWKFGSSRCTLEARKERGKSLGNVDSVARSHSPNKMRADVVHATVDGRSAICTFRHCARSQASPRPFPAQVSTNIHPSFVRSYFLFFVHPSKSIEFLMSTDRRPTEGSCSFSSGECSRVAFCLLPPSPIQNSLSKFDELTERGAHLLLLLPDPYYAHRPPVAPKTSNWLQNKSR